MKRPSLKFDPPIERWINDKIVLTASSAGEDEPGCTFVTTSLWNSKLLHQDRLNMTKPAHRERFAAVAVTKVVGLEQSDVEQHLLEFGEALTVALAEWARAADANGEGGEEDGEQASGRMSQASMLVALATEAGVDLFHDGEASFVTFQTGGHRETHAVRSEPFRNYLRQLYHDAAEGRAVGSQGVQDAIGTLDAQALFSGKRHSVFVRLAEEDGKIYLDLTGDRWQVVEISAEGWRLLSESPVKFRRRRGMLPLPCPESGGSVELLRPFVNTRSQAQAKTDSQAAEGSGDDHDWTLLIAFLIALYNPSIPYPVLGLHGEQGSAKTTLARIIRALIDPNRAAVRSQPKEPRDLMIAANNAWVLTFDNLSGIPQWVSDSFCCLSTGGGFSTRTLYENDEEQIFAARRPLILTGIGEVATRPDLLDRSLLVTLPAIPEESRRPERDLWAEFNQVAPRILGALLDAVSVGLRKLPDTKLKSLPRMADFALWVAAAETGLGWEAGTFMKAYDGNRAEANSIALESSAIGALVERLASEPAGWKGTAAELLRNLGEIADDTQKRRKDWPQRPRQCADELRRIAPNLRAAGITVTFSAGRARGRQITLRKDGERTQEDVGRTQEEGASSSPEEPNSCLYDEQEDAEDDQDAEIPYSGVGNQNRAPDPSWGEKTEPTRTAGNSSSSASSASSPGSPRHETPLFEEDAEAEASSSRRHSASSRRGDHRCGKCLRWFPVEVLTKQQLHGDVVTYRCANCWE